MIRKVLVPFLLSASALGMSLHAHAAPIAPLLNGSAMIGSSVGPLSSKSLNWYCSHTDSKGKGFKGNMVATLVYLPNGTREVRVSNVNIHKLGGQSGGSKANFEAHLMWSSATVKSAYSYDNLKQDGTANQLNWVLSTANTAFNPDKLRIKFTFDKSGGDPTCTTDVSL